MGPHAAHRFARRHFIAGLAGVCGGAHGFATDDSNVETLRSRRTEAMAGAPDALGRFTVPVWLNGRGPYQFPIDTAAGRSVIASEIAHQLALPPADEARLHGIAGAESCQTVHLRELSLGPLRGTNLEPLLLPRARLQVDGLLGLDVLEDRCAALDFTSHTLTVSRGRWGALGPLRRPGEAVVSGISRLGQLTFADCKADGARVYGFIDSGAQVSVGNEALAASLGERASANDQPITLQGATGQTAMARLGRINQFQLGQMQFRSMQVLFSDLHVFDRWEVRERPALLLGCDLLKLFALVEIDFGRRELRLQRADF